MSWILSLLLALLGVNDAESESGCTPTPEPGTTTCQVDEVGVRSSTPKAEGRSSGPAPSSPQISNGF
ncbi:MAG: hypothetical protein H6732_09515 [Alphaproteobacteria bacterium]|nr:hypothetical protein [Alphaproteobacteria bacterium]